MKKLLTALALGATLTATVHAQRHETDRERKGLKGPVKSVTVESAKVERKGKRYEEGRRALAEKEMFDAEGNLAEGESYGEGGWLKSSALYRHVGGEQIVEGRRALPTAHFDPGPAKSDPRDSQPARPSSPPPDALAPYTERFKYKYDAGGRVKEMTVESDGGVRQRIVYEYKGGRKETRWYEGDHLISREVDKFDARGNLAEKTELDVETGAVSYKYSYTAYEFDARGNWVKRLKTGTAAGETEEREVEYRTLTYF